MTQSFLYPSRVTTNERIIIYRRGLLRRARCCR